MPLFILQSLWTSFSPGHLVDWQVASRPRVLPLIQSAHAVGHPVTTQHLYYAVLNFALQHRLIGSWGWRWGLVLREEIFVSCFVFGPLWRSPKLQDRDRGPHSLTITFHSSAFFFFFFSKFSTAWPRTGEGEMLFEKERWQWRERLPAQLQASWWSRRRGHFTSLCFFPSCKKDKMD